MIKLDFKKFTLYLFILIIIFFLDRISKIYILNILVKSGEVDIYVNKFLSLILIWNKGIGFGLFSNSNDFFYNLTSLIIITINFVLIYFIIISKNLEAFFYTLILGGSLGNLFDRFYYSAVPDFIDINYNGFHWFVFNVADIFITIGIICLIFKEILEYKKVSNEK